MCVTIYIYILLKVEAYHLILLLSRYATLAAMSFSLKKNKVMFGNSFCFLFSKTCFWEYKEKNNFLVFLKSKTCLVS